MTGYDVLKRASGLLGLPVRRSPVPTQSVL